MLQLSNATPFSAKLMVLPDTQGVDTLFAIVKGTFTITPQVGLAEKQAPIVIADEHYADPGKSSISASSDICLGKPGTDVVMVGSAWASDGRPTWQTDVMVSVGSLVKRVRVFGDRVWEATPAGATMAWVAPFVRMPIVWERAYGGTDETTKGPNAEGRNPVGVGYRASGSTRPTAGTAVPNVEDPNALITKPSDAPPPAGFAPIAPHWTPRKAFAGTYDEEWQRNRAPYLPLDFDPRFFHVAPRELTSPRPLEGGEPVQIEGASPGGPMRFRLPALRVRVEYRFDNSNAHRPGALDTVVLRPDDNTVALVWRAALRCDKQTLKVREVGVSASWQ